MLKGFSAFKRVLSELDKTTDRQRGPSATVPEDPEADRRLS